MEKQEISYFEGVIKNIKGKIKKQQLKLEKVEEDFQLTKKDLADNRHEIEHGGDLANKFSELSLLEGQTIDIENNIKRLNRQKASPYFSRIDFTPSGKETEKIYIGLSTLNDGESIYVYDWRAPISSMYYDFTLGSAAYKVGKKLYSGDISLKRQYKIENSELLAYFDTTLAIEDDILRDVLSKNSSAKMKQIVSSIQKEQNIIVRTEEFDNLLIQGVAGSGKTSIALHRAAYLLYSHRGQLKSSDILIVSPNSVFSSYIEEVLPQLGEDNLIETSYEQLARIELRRPLQTREQMLDEIASTPSQEKLNEISFKSSFEYMGELIKFLRSDFLNTFTPSDLKFVVGTKENEEGKEIKIEKIFSADETNKLFFNDFKNMTIEERISKIAWQYAMRFTQQRHYNASQQKGLAKRFKSLLYKFLPITDIFKVHEIFLSRMGFKSEEKDEIDYMDKGALLAIKHYIHGFKHDFSAKYLIVDEMQDFSPLDLYVFKKLWTCPSIYLGDINQCIEKALNRGYLNEMASFLGAELIELKKTYRSTKQIAEFAHNMIGLDGIEYVNRDGENPTLIKSQDVATAISDIIASHCTNFAHTAIICKCQKEVNEISSLLKGRVEFKELIEPDDYNNPVILTTCATAKGIEFDCVIVPFANKENYRNSLDKNILYVASTRALHKLFFISTTTQTTFLKNI